MVLDILILILVGFNIGGTAFVVYKLTRKPKVIQMTSPNSRIEPPVDMAKLEQEKQRLVAEAEAFRQLMGYNADVAYGITRRQ
jgi:hypothetical protein